MVDSGATGEAFMHESFAQKHQYDLLELRNPRRLFLADGEPTQSGDITHVAHVDIDINGHTEKQIFYITNLGKYDIILGKPWLAKHNPHIDWTENAVTFNSNYCRTRCLKKDCFQLHVKGTAALSIASSSIVAPRPATPRRLGAAAFHALASQNDTELMALSMYEVDRRLAELGTIVEKSTFATRKNPPPIRLDSAFTSVRMMDQQLGKHDRDTSRDLDLDHPKDSYTRRRLAADMHLSGASLEDIRKALEPKVLIDPATKVPSITTGTSKCSTNRRPPNYRPIETGTMKSS